MNTEEIKNLDGITLYEKANNLLPVSIRTELSNKGENIIGKEYRLLYRNALYIYNQKTDEFNKITDNKLDESIFPDIKKFILDKAINNNCDEILLKKIQDNENTFQSCFKHITIGKNRTICVGMINIYDILIERGYDRNFVQDICKHVPKSKNNVNIGDSEILILTVFSNTLKKDKSSNGDLYYIDYIVINGEIKAIKRTHECKGHNSKLAKYDMMSSAEFYTGPLNDAFCNGDEKIILKENTKKSGEEAKQKVAVFNKWQLNCRGDFCKFIKNRRQINTPENFANKLATAYYMNFGIKDIKILNELQQFILTKDSDIFTKTSKTIHIDKSKFEQLLITIYIYLLLAAGNDSFSIVNSETGNLFYAVNQTENIQDLLTYINHYAQYMKIEKLPSMDPRTNGINISLTI